MFEFEHKHKHFDRELIEEFNKKADEKKRLIGPQKGKRPSAVGGDPDLFAYRRKPKGDSRDRLFVEVKRKTESLTDKQKAEFPVIRRVLGHRCELWRAWIEKR